ncbi:MAG: hypothetical protein BWY71_02412 [Planctomycetes bacterium ADurb.Bin412]|nr:MAG: hypothetical protein BWY71_02412 [Planctomycetes bacterium ADurb.Bin412]
MNRERHRQLRIFYLRIGVGFADRHGHQTIHRILLRQRPQVTAQIRRIYLNRLPASPAIRRIRQIHRPNHILRNPADFMLTARRPYLPAFRIRHDNHRRYLIRPHIHPAAHNPALPVYIPIPRPQRIPRIPRIPARRIISQMQIPLHLFYTIPLPRTRIISPFYTSAAELFESGIYTYIAVNRTDIKCCGCLQSG